MQRMRLSKAGKDIIKDHEALRLKAYLPTRNDVWTIGWGHTGTAKAGMVITEAQAEKLLEADVSWAEDVVRSTVTVPLNQNQFDALVSMVFNIGGTNFRRSSALDHLNDGNYLKAADAMLLWNKQRNKTTGELNELKGLTRRRKQERELFLTPVTKPTPIMTPIAGAGGAGAVAAIVTEHYNIADPILMGGIAVVAALVLAFVLRKR